MTGRRTAIPWSGDVWWRRRPRATAILDLDSVEADFLPLLEPGPEFTGPGVDHIEIRVGQWLGAVAVSYTHLTLPTKA